jgi:hypothetical protein
MPVDNAGDKHPLDMAQAFSRAVFNKLLNPQALPGRVKNQALARMQTGARDLFCVR